jgi:superfamily II DNA helicase RecQ
MRGLCAFAQPYRRAGAAGKHTVVCTATASGKSLCYNLPVLEGLAADPGATALYLFPTKALAQARAAPAARPSVLRPLQSTTRRRTSPGSSLA